MVDNLAHVDPKLAMRVATPLGIKAPDAKAAAGRLGFRDHRITNQVDEDPALRMTGGPGGSVRTRKIAILVADGVDPASIKRIQQDLLEAGAMCKFVAPQLGTVSTVSGRQLAARSGQR